MTIEELKRLSDRLYKSYPPDSDVDFDLANDVVMIRVDNPVSGSQVHKLPIYNLIDEIEFEENNKDENVDVSFDGISNVRSWKRGPKQRIYFRAVGVPESAHKQGRVFLELVNGQWVPNMRYKLMQDFAGSLNMAGINDSDIVEDLYQKYLEEF